MEPFWRRFYDLERELNRELLELQIPPNEITHVYNPVEYAAEVHCKYLSRYLKGTKKVMFVGMNPGPNGMTQTGVPFGNVRIVRDVMELSGEIQQPPQVHPRRPVKGFEHNIEEPSGSRLWGLMKSLAGGSLDTFAQQCFVHNFCPLIFFNEAGQNVTPPNLKDLNYRENVERLCLETLDEEIALLQPEIVVAIGKHVFECIQNSVHAAELNILYLIHPSPRVPNNQNWPEVATNMLEANGLIKFIRNSV